MGNARPSKPPCLRLGLKLRISSPAEIRLEPWGLQVPLAADTDYQYEQEADSRGHIVFDISRDTLCAFGYPGARVLLRHPDARWPLADLNVPDRYLAGATSPEAEADPEVVPPSTPLAFVGRFAVPQDWVFHVVQAGETRTMKSPLTPWILVYGGHKYLPRLVVREGDVVFEADHRVYVATDDSSQPAQKRQ